jgi:hypothetical protein
MLAKTIGIILTLVGLVILTSGLYTFSVSNNMQAETSVISPSATIFAQLELNQGDRSKLL